jgi:hypothetical protein
VPEERRSDVYQLEIVCAWCGRYLGAKSAETEVEPRFTVSHGICGPCKTQLLAEVEEALNQSPETQNIIERR